MTTFSAHPLLQMLGLGQVPQAVKPGVQMQPGFMGRINAGVRRSAGMPQQRFPLQGYPENPSLQGQPPLQWAAPNHAGGEMQLTNAGHAPGMIPVHFTPQAAPPQAAQQPSVHPLLQQMNQQQNYMQAKEAAAQSNWRASPEDSSVGVRGLNATPRSAMYPAHPYAGKFPLLNAGADSPEVRDIGASNRAILGEIQAGNIPSNLIRPNMTPEQANAASAAWNSNKQQWAISDARRAANATRDYEAQKTALQRRNELMALRGKRGNMAENWIQSQYRMENPGLFAQPNPDVLRFMAAANARQRMDAPQFGGNYNPMELDIARQNLDLQRQTMIGNMLDKLTPEQKAAFIGQLGLGPNPKIPASIPPHPLMSAVNAPPRLRGSYGYAQGGL